MITNSRLGGEKLGRGLVISPLIRGIALFTGVICIGMAGALVLADLFAMVFNWLHPSHYPFLMTFGWILAFLVLAGAAQSIRDRH
jgi:hypothetical protein